MSITINSNMAASYSALNMKRANNLLTKSLQRLSSGKRITAPSDDAGGLAVSMKLLYKGHPHEDQELLHRGLERRRSVLNSRERRSLCSLEAEAVVICEEKESAWSRVCGERFGVGGGSGFGLRE